MDKAYKGLASRTLPDRATLLSPDNLVTIIPRMSSRLNAPAGFSLVSRCGCLLQSDLSYQSVWLEQKL